MTDTLTGFLALATAALVLMTAFLAYRTRADVKQVHILVNSKMTAALERIEQLTTALLKSDTPVPEEPSGTPV